MADVSPAAAGAGARRVVRARAPAATSAALVSQLAVARSARACVVAMGIPGGREPEPSPSGCARWRGGWLLEAIGAGVGCDRRQLVPRAAVKLAAAALGPHASPLLEEERDLLGLAAVA
jgi:hypothetical protein